MKYKKVLKGGSKWSNFDFLVQFRNEPKNIVNNTCVYRPFKQTPPTLLERILERSSPRVCVIVKPSDT